MKKILFVLALIVFMNFSVSGSSADLVKITNFTWDGSLEEQTTIPPSYIRNDNIDDIELGSFGLNRVPQSQDINHRIDFDINLTPFDQLGDLEGLDIERIKFHIYIIQNASSDSDILRLRISHMEQNSTQYPDVPQIGNFLFWNDTANGTLYHQSNIFGINDTGINLTLTNAGSDYIEAKLKAGDFFPSLGFSLSQENRPRQTDWTKMLIGASTNSNQTRVPVVWIDYNLDPCYPSKIGTWFINQTCNITTDRDNTGYLLHVGSNGNVNIEGDGRVHTSEEQWDRGSVLSISHGGEYALIRS